MKHVVLKHLDDEFIQLIPHKGYKLYNNQISQYFSEAILKNNDIKYFSAIKL
jgi:hypothetical protein